jgi:hypothetical protein
LAAPGNVEFHLYKRREESLTCGAEELSELGRLLLVQLLIDSGE